MTRATRPDVAEMERSELEQLIVSLGAESFHAGQIFRWLYRQGVTDFASMTDLSQGLRAALAAAVEVQTPAIAHRAVSSDGTTKYLLRLRDGKVVEAVFIPDTPSQTFCISTQVGCAMGCGFCLTGKMGLVRNLSAGEIVAQVRVLARDQNLLQSAFNIVVMGMGEPLHNYDATMKAFRILATKEGAAIPSRRVTLSTVGVLPALERLATEPFMPNLAVSLHATTDDQRSALVPLNRKYRVADLIEACKRFPTKRRDRITFEYVLLAGVNDTRADALRLSRLLAGVRAKVNLLPLNEAPGIPFVRPSDEAVNAFAKILAEKGVTVMVRRSRGRDIRAACGQLIVEGLDRSPAQRMAELMG